VAALMLIAVAIGWAAGPDHQGPAQRSGDVVAIYRLSGDLPAAADDTRPTLRAAAALPRIRGAAGRAPARPVEPEPVATPSATPAPAASAEPTATPEVTVVPVATAPPAPAPTAAPPRPTATPAPTFDSEG
jgi:hypothetical protein